MYLFEIVYRPYSWQGPDRNATLAIVARKTEGATEEARFVMRKNHHKEGVILSVVQQREIHRVHR